MSMSMLSSLSSDVLALLLFLQYVSQVSLFSAAAWPNSPSIKLRIPLSVLPWIQACATTRGNKQRRVSQRRTHPSSILRIARGVVW